MSTTFAVKVPSIKTYEDGEEVEVEVAFRSNGMRWLDPIAQLLPDDTEVIPIDNSPQGVYTIGDIRKAINGDANSLDGKIIEVDGKKYKLTEL